MTASPEIQKIAIITGASTGIGAATARELARRGSTSSGVFGATGTPTQSGGRVIEPLVSTSPTRTTSGS
jgi:hypothetical protein